MEQTTSTTQKLAHRTLVEPEGEDVVRTAINRERQRRMRLACMRLEATWRATHVVALRKRWPPEGTTAMPAGGRPSVCTPRTAMAGPRDGVRSPGSREGGGLGVRWRGLRRLVGGGLAPAQGKGALHGGRRPSAYSFAASRRGQLNVILTYRWGWETMVLGWLCLSVCWLLHIFNNSTIPVTAKKKKGFRYQGSYSIIPISNGMLNCSPPLSVSLAMKESKLCWRTAI